VVGKPGRETGATCALNDCLQVPRVPFWVLSDHKNAHHGDTKGELRSWGVLCWHAPYPVWLETFDTYC